jgi:hypothetical protein
VRDVAFLCWPFVCVYAIWRWAQVVERFAPQGAGVQPEDVAIPEDIIAFVMSYPADWAQDDALRAVREKYAEHKSWDKVRGAFGLAPLPSNG